MAHDNKPRARRATVSVIGLIAACALAAGCGSNSNRSASNSGSATQELAYSKCIRAHGIAGFPDPGANIPGPHDSIGGIAIPPTINTELPAFQTAQNACRGQLSAAFPRQGRPQITAALKASLIAHAQCMRTHGVPTYLDPAFPPAGGIAVTDPPGVDLQSPAYQRAVAECDKR
jgi:hypothetical protein